MTGEKQTFEQYVKEVMNRVVKTHQHNHPLYQETRIHQSIIDNENNRAAFVLFEQIDTSGELENQFRYSLWFVREREDPKNLYENHGYLRNPGYYKGFLGREPKIGIEKILEDGIVASITPEQGGIAHSLSQIQVKIGLDGKISEIEDFLEQAKNLIKKKHAYQFDYLRQAERLDDEDIAVINWRVSSRGYEIVYLIWKDSNTNELKSKRLNDTCGHEDRALDIADFRADEHHIFVRIDTDNYKIDRTDINLKRAEKN